MGRAKGWKRSLMRCDMRAARRAASPSLQLVARLDKCGCEALYRPGDALGVDSALLIEDLVGSWHRHLGAEHGDAEGGEDLAQVRHGADRAEGAGRGARHRGELAAKRGIAAVVALAVADVAREPVDGVLQERAHRGVVLRGGD